MARIGPSPTTIRTRGARETGAPSSGCSRPMKARPESRWRSKQLLLRPVGERHAADHAVQGRAELLAARLVGEHPRAALPRRVVAHVLAVPALEVGDPFAF